MASGFTSRATEDTSRALPAAGAGEAGASLWLLCRTSARCFAFLAESAAETMRALPVEPVAGAPSFVLGISVIRGEPVAIVDTASLLGVHRNPGERFVTVRAGKRTIGFAVESVIGIRAIPQQALEALPALLGGNEAIEAIAALDEGLTFFLSAARAIPDEVLAMLEGSGGAHDL